MSQRKSRFNQYSVPVPAGVVGVNGIAPNTPNRNYLEVQNTGVNPVQIGFGRSTVGYTIYAGTSKTWDDVVPIDSLNFLSLLGTTVVILEGHSA